MSGIGFDDLDDLDEGANNATPSAGASLFDSLVDLDATPESIDTERQAAAMRAPNAGFQEWHAPGDAGSSRVTVPVAPDERMESDKPSLGGSATAQRQGFEALEDGAYAAAGGAMSGIGVNPGQAFGNKVGNRLAEGEARSPIAAPVGKFMGETAMQLAATPAKLGVFASNAIGGGASAVGNTAGDWKDKARAGVKGFIEGGVLGSLLHGAGKGVGALEDGLRGSSNRSYLRQGGATSGDLQALDKGIPGGAQGVAQRGREAGIGEGWFDGPTAYADDASRAIDKAEATRGKLTEGAPDLDPVAVPDAMQRAGVKGIPDTTEGIPGKIRKAVAPEVAAVRQMGAPQHLAFDAQGAMEVPARGIPFEDANNYRKLIGNKTNWANDPAANDAAMQRMHGALNDEMGDALSLQNPGSGEAWRNAGRSERDAIAMREMAGRAQNRGGGPTIADAVLAAPAMASGGMHAAANVGLGRLAKSQANSVAKNVTGGMANVAAMSGAAAPIAGKLGAVGGGQQSGSDPAQQALNFVHGPSGGQELGPFKALFFQAAVSPDKAAVQSLVTRLANTNAEFRQNVLPLLSGR